MPGCRRVVVALLAATVVAAPQRAVNAQQPPSALLFRIFLLDGRTLTSFGDFARVGDRVVFSLPLGDDRGTPRLHLASVPADQVDWNATDQYRDAARAANYARTRGDDDFAAMSGQVARLLNDIAKTPDRNQQLAIAEEARERLASWPREHYGYRQDDVRQILGLLDEVVSELRAARGESRFDLNLVAGVAPPDTVPIQPPPTLQESIQQALTAASLAGSPSDRVSLLQSAIALLGDPALSLPSGWAKPVRDHARGELARELEVNRAYSKLRERALHQANRAAQRADVRGVEKVLADVRKRDARLGGRRSDDVVALVAAVEERLDAARRLRLARDQWQARVGALHAYRDAVGGPLREIARARATLDDIRTLAGPEAGRLARTGDRLTSALAGLRTLTAPADLQTVHTIVLSALQLADNAVRLRKTAISSGNLQTAWDASAAAAGALMLADRARGDLERLLEPPALQ